MSVAELSAGAANMYTLLTAYIDKTVNKMISAMDERHELAMAKLAGIDLNLKSVEARLSVLELAGAKKVASRAVAATVKTPAPVEDEPMLSDQEAASEEKPAPKPRAAKKKAVKESVEPTIEPAEKKPAKAKASKDASKDAVKPRALAKTAAKPAAKASAKDSLKTNEDGNGINGYTQFCKWALVHRDDFREEFLTEEIAAALEAVPAIAKCEDDLDRRVLEGEYYWSKLASEDAKTEIKARFNQWKVERKKVNDAVEVDAADSEEE
jgi:hypothetical protein